MKAKYPKSEIKKEKKVYKKPILSKLGNMAKVTKKSGASSDVGHPTMN